MAGHIINVISFGGGLPPAYRTLVSMTQKRSLNRKIAEKKKRLIFSSLAAILR